MTLKHCAFLLIPVLLMAQDPDPVAVLRRATAKVLESVQRAPHYSCVQTVNRNFYGIVKSHPSRDCASTANASAPTDSKRLVEADRLRLEVTVAERGEIFSWAGSSQFVDDSIDHVVTSGSISSGVFSGFLNSAFQQGASHLTFVRSVVVDGRNLLEYAFRVDQADSAYRIKLVIAENEWFKTAFSGTIMIDPVTAGIVSLTAQTDELPPAAGSCRTMTSIEFGTVDLAGFPFPLPTIARQRFVYGTGLETVNTITFSGCRAYHSDSTLSFNEPDHAGNPGRGQAAELPTVPPDLQFVLELNEPLDFNTVAAGDPFTARLAEPLVDTRGKLLAPAGTTVTGRLTCVEFRIPTNDIVLMLKPKILEIPGAPMRIFATRAWFGTFAKPKHDEILFPRPDEEDSGGFIFKSPTSVVPQGFRTAWRTRYPITGKRPAGVDRSKVANPKGPVNLDFEK